MRGLVLIFAIAAASATFSASAQAKVHITVDLDRQTMHVEADDRAFDWKISSGKPGYETPPGTYHVLWMDKDHHSDEYDQAPMPNAIFFSPGFAIHGFGRSPWGHAASHGCVRLPIAKAAILFDLVKAKGADIEIVGDAPPATVTARRSRQNDDRYSYDAAVSAPGGFYDRADGNGTPSYQAPQPPPVTDPLYGQMY